MSILQDMIMFDQTYYLNQNPDVKAAYLSGQVDPWEHYVLFGGKELRAPNAVFNPEYYLLQNPDVIQAVASGQFANAFHHFYTYGLIEGRVPSADYAAFDADTYLAANPDVKTAIDSGAFAGSAFFHFVQYGFDEGRAGGITPPSPDPNPGQTFTLTTGVDNIMGTAGNDTIKGVVSATAGESTFQLADTIDGKGGTNSFFLTVSGAKNMPLAEITNVENFFIKDLTGGNTHDFANVSGEQQVWTYGSTGNTTIKNIDRAAIGVKDITGAANTHTFIFKDTAFQSTAALDIAVENAGNVVTGNQQTFDIQAATTAGAANAINLMATGTNTVNFTATGTDIAAAGGIKTLNVSGTGFVNINAVADAGGGALKTNLTTVDATQNSGGVSIQLDKTTVKFTGGSGNDTVLVGGAMTKGAEFNLGAGNDYLKIAGGIIDKNVIVDAGAGVDTISNGLITVANGGVFKNFNKLAMDTAVTTDIELLTGSTIDSYLINDNKAAIASNVASGSTIDVTSTTGASDVTFNVKGAAAATDDSLLVNFTGAEQAATPAAANIKAGNVVAANVETIDVVSGGGANTWNALGIKGATGLQTMTITGEKNLDLAFTAVVGTNPVAGQGGAVNLIDASGLNGKLNINLANVTYDDKVGFTLEAGAGNDTITTNASSATLSGNGGDDKYIVTATVAGATDNTAKITTITDFNEGDMITAAAIVNLVDAQAAIAGATDIYGAGGAIDLALAATAAVVDAAWFVYGSNTYIAIDVNNNQAFDAGDHVVKLEGVLDFSDAQVAANTITLL